MTESPVSYYSELFIGLRIRYCFTYSKTEVYDKKIRGGIQNDASAEESLKCFFNGGLYSKILEDMDDWCVADLGRLLVGTTRVTKNSWHI